MILKCVLDEEIFQQKNPRRWWIKKEEIDSDKKSTKNSDDFVGSHKNITVKITGKGEKKGEFPSDKKNGDKKVTKNSDKYSELQNFITRKGTKKGKKKVNHQKILYRQDGWNSTICNY